MKIIFIHNRMIIQGVTSDLLNKIKKYTDEI